MLRLLSIFLCVIVFSPISFAVESDECLKRHCLAIVDAGSSGSRLHVYSFSYDNTNSPIEIKELWSKKTKPGFATIEANSTSINNYLNDLFKDNPYKNIPAYFYATAGMRLLPPKKQKAYYLEVNKWFNDKQEWSLVEAKTISGNEEALFDWLSVNYHLGALQSPNKTPVGVMDMGGASVQIVFPISQEAASDQKSINEIDIYGKHMVIYVRSFLGLGQNEMSHQFLNAAPCFSYNYPLPDGDSGKGNALNCAQEISTLLNQVHGVNQTIQPLLSTTKIDGWYAIGGISYFAENPLLHFENHQITSKSLLDQANHEFCQNHWEELNNKFPNDEMLYAYCLLSSYYYALMVEGYGFKPYQEIHVVPTADNIDWTLGVVLHHQN